MASVLDYSGKFTNCHVAVIGDLMLDEYAWGHIERISPEAPVPILNIVNQECALGGAGNVVRNLRAIGVNVTVLGVVGEDTGGFQIRRLIESLEVDAVGIVCDPTRSSTRKIRLMSIEHGQQVFRMDQESARCVRPEIEDELLSHVDRATLHANVVLCSDYSKGALTRRVLNGVFEMSRKCGIPTLVGPKGFDAERYRGATVLMPNQRELAQLTRTSVAGDPWLTSAAAKLIDNLSPRALVVTRGKDGMSLFEAAGSGQKQLDIPTMARSVYDVTGAGDTAISMLAAMIAAGASLESAVYLANLAAGIKVGKRGTSTVTIEELKEHLWEERRGIACAASR